METLGYRNSSGAISGTSSAKSGFRRDQIREAVRQHKRPVNSLLTVHQKCVTDEVRTTYFYPPRESCMHYIVTGNPRKKGS